MNTHESYVSLETAKLLKQSGFNWNTFGCYRNDTEDVEMCHVDFNWNMDKKDYEKEGSDNLFHGFITSDEKGLIVDDFVSAPTLAVAQKWLREVKGIETYAHVFYDSRDMSDEWDVYVYEVNHITKHTEDYILSYDIYHTYEEAQEAGIKKALELILEK